MFRRYINSIKNKLIRERIVPVFVTNIPSKILSGKNAIVSGGSSGIGYGIAKLMSESGCNVLILGTNEEKLKIASSKINVDYLVLNINIVQEIDAKIKEISKNKNIDILVNSAGVHGKDNFGAITEDGWNSVMNVNLRGLYFLSQAVANHMIERKISGHILNISSASSLKPSWTPYEISKRAVDGITRGMAHKLISNGIIVNGLAPGPTATPMLQFDKQKVVDLSWPGNPSGRVSTVEEIANLALFLVSDLGNGIVGDTIFMSGGSGTICIDK